MNKIDLNDGKIVKIESSKGTVFLTYLNWEEKIHKLLFSDVIYFEHLYAGLETGDFIIDSNNKTIVEVCDKLEESRDGYKLFKIICPWSENTLIKIIAKEVSNQEILEKDIL